VDSHACEARHQILQRSWKADSRKEGWAGTFCSGIGPLLQPQLDDGLAARRKTF
jgi:hypothetical protein